MSSALADHMAASQLAATFLDEAVAAKSSLPDGAVTVPVCQSATVIGVDEHYQERVGLANVVRLYNQGFLKLS